MADSGLLHDRPVLLTLVVAWLVLSALATVVCSLVTRGGLREDRTRGYLPDDGPDDDRPRRDLVLVRG